MKSLREEIYNLTYVWCVEANYETDKFIDEVFQLIEKRIDSIDPNKYDDAAMGIACEQTIDEIKEMLKEK